MAPSRRPRILHVSGDFPDLFNPNKTNVIRSLVDLVSDRFDQSVFSLNRTSPDIAGTLTLLKRRSQSLIVETAPEAGGVIPIRYHGPARGLLHRTVLERLADSIAVAVEDMPRPDLLIGHKLTIEGIVVARLSERLGIPYAISIQGNTDTRILATRPDLSRHLGRVWHGAAVAFPFAPWAHRAVAAKLGERRGPTIELPCPTPADTILSPTVEGSRELASVFHLRNWRLKNLPRLARAAQSASRTVSGLRVAVVGGGGGARY